MPAAPGNRNKPEKILYLLLHTGEAAVALDRLASVGPDRLIRLGHMANSETLANGVEDHPAGMIPLETSLLFYYQTR